MKDIGFIPEISVIVPVYNAEEFIERCLCSLLGQDFTKSYEIVVINDGSSDGSLGIIERIAKEHKNIIRVFSQPNGGISAARNAGLSHVRGKYVLFTDSDDFVERRYLSALYDAAERSGADITCCNYDVETALKDYESLRLVINRLQVAIDRANLTNYVEVNV